MYRFPSTSVSTHPCPDSNATGNSLTWPLSPLKCLVQRAWYSFDAGPGGGTMIRGQVDRSTLAQFKEENRLADTGGTLSFSGMVDFVLVRSL